MNIINKFHQSYTYTEVGTGISVEFTLLRINNDLRGLIKVFHPVFPPVCIELGSVKPSLLESYESELRKLEKNNQIENLTFGQEMTMVETSICMN